ncbi:MAG: response regulator transcription factor [Candidatus Neomarinimicrobiota bacterium]
MKINNYATDKATGLNVKIFIADDSQLLQERLITILSRTSSIEIVGRAFDVKEAIAGIKNTRPDVVFLDIRMPDGTGFEVMDKIKQNGKIPIFIILTNYSYHQYRQRAVEMGAKYFLEKDKDFSRIPAIIAELE